MSGFKPRKRENINFKTPQEMYDDYKNREIKGIHDHQSKMIDNYMQEAFDKPNVALELPTGTGKTLIGLLIGEFRRRKNKEKVLYICPTNQLVHQTVEYSKNKYGIKAIAFTGKIKDFDPKDKAAYSLSQAIAVTSYSSLFNTNSFFSDADIIIFDDAHSGESYVSSNWTLSVSRTQYSELYKLIVDLVKPAIDEVFYDRMQNETPHLDDYNWFDKVPNIRLRDLLPIILKNVDSFMAETNCDLRYAWSNIRNHLHACNVLLSYKEISIRPYIPPTLTHRPFHDAKQRIFMSATLGKSGELERSYGIMEIYRLPMVKDWENKSIGRKYFMFPNISFESDKRSEIVKKITVVSPRTMMIVNDNETATKVIAFLKKDTDVEIFTAKDIEKSKDKFVNSDNGFAVIANRFDGIDFPDDECRMLILFDLPNATHLQEKFLISRMSAMTLFEERIKTRVVQALGRCTRSQTDFAAVCIFGDELTSSLLSPSKIAQFNPELQAELSFGQHHSSEQNSVDEYLNLLNIFLNDREQWEESGCEEDIIGERDEIIDKGIQFDVKVYEALLNSSKYEVQAQYDIWRENYNSALSNVDRIMTILSPYDDLKGYRGYWAYVGACCSYALFKNGNVMHKAIYCEYLEKASKTTISINWFNKLIEDENQLKSITIENMDMVIENLEKLMNKYSNTHLRKYYSELDTMLTLVKSENGEDFEKGHVLLGTLMGFKSLKPKGKGTPDPIWLLNDEICLVSEDKIYENDQKAIPIGDIKQANGHINWIKANAMMLNINKKTRIITIFISNSKYVDEDGVIHSNELFYLNRDEFVALAERAVKVLKELIRSYKHPGDATWRELAVRKYIDSSISPLGILDVINKKKVADLKSK